MTDFIEIIFIELPKFKTTHKDYNDKLHRWLMFLANPNGSEVEELMKSDEAIREAMDALYEISGDKETVMLANMREKALMDEQSRLKGAKEEGRKEGETEIVIKLLIQKFKELPEKYINNIKKLPQGAVEAIVTDIFEIEKIEELERYFQNE